MLDARLGAKIMVAVEPFVVQPLASPIGGCRDSAAAGSAADDFDREMEDRHDDLPHTPYKRTSARRISAPSSNKFSFGRSEGRSVGNECDSKCRSRGAPST